MAKRYDPIMCMMVDEPTKAQDAMPSDLKKAGYEVGTVEKYGSTYYTLVYNGKVISTSPTEANIVEKAKKHYANRHDKARDADPIAALSNFKKTAEYGDSTKIDIGKGFFLHMAKEGQSVTFGKISDYTWEKSGQIKNIDYKGALK